MSTARNERDTVGEEVRYVRRQLTWPALMELGRQGVEAYAIDGPGDYDDEDPNREYMCFVPVGSARCLDNLCTCMDNQGMTNDTISVAPDGNAAIDATPLPYVYWDEDSDPADPGWVLRYLYRGELVGEALQADDIDNPDEAVAEASAFLARQ